MNCACIARSDYRLKSSRCIVTAANCGFGRRSGRCRMGCAQQEQFAGVKPPTLRPDWQRPAQPVGGQDGSDWHAIDMHMAVHDANVLWRNCAHTFEQRDVRWQITALCGQRGGIWRQTRQDDVACGQGTRQRIGVMSDWFDAIPADRHAVGRVVNQAR